MIDDYSLPSITERSEADFTNGLRTLCQPYVDAQPGRYFRLGPVRFRVMQVGRPATDSWFTDAIAQHETNLGPVDLTISIIDQHTSAIQLPEPVWNWTSIGVNGAIAGLNARFFAQFHQENLMFTWLDSQQQTAFIWADDLRNLPEWERSFPFRTVLHEWLQRQPDAMLAERLVLAHAGAVGTSAGGVLLTGRGGSGKSTATLACLGSGLQYAGDDFVLLNIAEQVVHGLYNVAKIEPANLIRFPQLAGWIANPNPAPGQKFQLFLQQHAPEQVSLGFPIRAILLPRFSGERDTTLSPATAAEALRAIAPSTTGLLGGDVRAFGRLSRLVRQLPTFWLHTGTDLAQIPDVIQQLITNLLPHESTD